MTASALPVVRRVAIVGSNRIPFARSNTAYATASNQDMLTFTLQGLIDRYDLHGLRLGEVDLPIGEPQHLERPHPEDAARARELRLAHRRQRATTPSRQLIEAGLAARQRHQVHVRTPARRAPQEPACEPRLVVGVFLRAGPEHIGASFAADHIHRRIVGLLREPQQ